MTLATLLADETAAARLRAQSVYATAAEAEAAMLAERLEARRAFVDTLGRRMANIDLAKVVHVLYEDALNIDYKDIKPGRWDANRRPGEILHIVLQTMPRTNYYADMYKTLQCTLREKYLIAEDNHDRAAGEWMGESCRNPVTKKQFFLPLQKLEDFLQSVEATEAYRNIKRSLKGMGCTRPSSPSRWAIIQEIRNLAGMFLS